MKRQEKEEGKGRRRRRRRIKKYIGTLDPSPSNWTVNVDNNNRLSAFSQLPCSPKHKDDRPIKEEEKYM